MFTVKICGITRPDDARAVAAAGADAIGLNFYPQSPRVIDLDRARAIIAELPAGMIKVGLFVNAPSAEICRTCDTLGLDLIQLHGDEPPELLAALGKRPAMKAFRVAGPEGLQAIANYLEICRVRGCMPRMILLDALGPRLRRERQIGRLVACQAIHSKRQPPHAGACRGTEGGKCCQGDPRDRGYSRRHGQRGGIAAGNQGPGHDPGVCPGGQAGPGLRLILPACPT